MFETAYDCYGVGSSHQAEWRGMVVSCLSASKLATAPKPRWLNVIPAAADADSRA
jgi:hypothetical protein